VEPHAAPAPDPGLRTTSAATAAALAQLDAASWSDVSKARILLTGDREGAVAGLVARVDRDDTVVLTDTADLIYPGAKEFYGHGYALPYDLDHLGDRAGWVLEEVTFHDFGFSDGVGVTGPEDPAHAVTRRQRARDAVRTWWKAAAGSWRCYDALVDAMKGPAPGLAYAWLRDWEAAPCAGFTAEAFRRDLLPIVTRHAGDPAHPLHEQAALLLRDLDTQLPRLVTVPLGLVLVRLGTTTPATTVAELETTLGPPASDIGSGIHIFVYPVADGGEVRVGTADGTSVMYVRFVQHGHERVIYPAPH